KVDQNSLPKMEIFEKIKTLVSEQEAFRVFNMGCGMVLVADVTNVEAIMKIAKVHNPFKMGVITNDKNSSVSIG
ncbi:MAG: AIR synthase-related protein, partial [bacterium]